MTPPESFTEIGNPRLRRVIDVLSIASLGEFDPEKVVIPLEGREDDLAMLEQTVNILVAELADAKRKNQQAAEAMREKLATIERQQLSIRDLSTPIIEIWDDILTLPIVGLVDTERSMEMTEKLLHRIADRQARCVIIDVTGVDAVDTATADHFIKMIQSAQLVGAHCVVTGISPEIAQTLVRIGVVLDGVPTLRSLKEGLKECIALLRRKPDVAR